MSRIPVALVALAIGIAPMTTACAQPSAAAEIPASLNWKIEPAGERTPADHVQFNISYRHKGSLSVTGRPVQLRTLDGLTAGQLAGRSQPVAFRISRDAGRLDCRGQAGGGRGDGTCAFAPNAAFPAALRQRGVNAPTVEQQFQLTMSDIGLTYVDELKRLDYATPTAADLVTAGHHGANLARLRGMADVGYRLGSVAALVRATDHGVSPAWVRAMQEEGLGRLPIDDLIRLRDHGVNGSFVRGMRDAGYDRLTAEQLVQLRDHGVTAAFAAELSDMGYGRLPVDALVRLRDHGVSAAFVRTANGRSGSRLGPDELIRRRNRGE